MMLLQKTVHDKIKLSYNAKFPEIEGNILSISGSATRAAVIVLGQKISSISNLVKNIDYEARISNIDPK